MVFTVALAEFTTIPELNGIVDAAVNGVRLTAPVVDNLKIPFVSVRKFVGAVKVVAVMLRVLVEEVPMFN